MSLPELKLKLDVDALVRSVKSSGGTRRYVVFTPQRTTEDALFGLPVKVEGYGIVGQYLGRTEYFKDGEKWWRIIVGVYALYGLVDGESARTFIPISVVAPTPDIAKYADRFRDFYEYRQATGVVDTAEKAIVNLDDVYAGRDLVIRIDPSGVSTMSDTELRRKYAELHAEYSRLADLYAKLEAAYRAASDRARIAESQVVAVRAHLSTLSEMAAEYVARMQEAELKVNEALRRMKLMATEVSTEEDLREKLRTWVEQLTETFETASAAMAAARQMLQQVIETGEAEGAAEERRPAEKKEEEGAG